MRGNIDVVEIHGDLNKRTKFYQCRAFCDSGVWDGYDTDRVDGCFGTSAINIGFDHPGLCFQVNVSWYNDWMQWRQHIDRLSRQGQESTSHLLFGFKDFQGLCLQFNLNIIMPIRSKHSFT